MTYDTVATVSQVASLLIFIGLFMAVLGYALWPGNRTKFEKAAHAALEPDKKKTNTWGRP